MINRANWGAWLYGALCIPIYWAMFYDLGCSGVTLIFAVVVFPLGGVAVYFMNRRIHADFEYFRSAMGDPYQHLSPDARKYLEEKSNEHRREGSSD